MNMYHVIYLEVGTLKQQHPRAIANSVPHAIYLSKLKIGSKWESLVDCYLMERGGAK